MDDLVARIRAGLDADERAALAWPVDERLWQVVGKRHLTYANGAGENIVTIDVSGRPLDWWERIWVRRDLDGLAEHIARHGPARALSEVAAKRRLLADVLAEQHLRVHGDEWYSCAQARDEDGEWACSNDTVAGGPCDCGRDERVRRRLEMLAEPYGSGHG